MGTELERRGARSQLPLWSAWSLLESPALVLAVHRDDVEAGADILTANTFRTHRRSLEKAGKRDACRGADPAGRGPRRGSRPTSRRGPSSWPARSRRSRTATARIWCPRTACSGRSTGSRRRSLAQAGVDLILAETHNTVRELVAAVRAGARRPGSRSSPRRSRTGTGGSSRERRSTQAARALEPLRPDALAINCVPARSLLADLRGAVGGGSRGAARGLRQPRSSDRARRHAIPVRDPAGRLRGPRASVDRRRRADRRGLLRHDRRAHGPP